MKQALKMILIAVVAGAIGYGLGSFEKKEKLETLGTWIAIDSASHHLLNLHLINEEEKLTQINEAAYIAALTNLEFITRETPEMDVNWSELKGMKDDWGVPDLLRHSREKIKEIEFTTPERKSKAIALLDKIESNQSGDDNSE
jgi:hypothetical protein